MKHWIASLLLFFSLNLYSQQTQVLNYDGIGTFLGGEDPFPWGEELPLPDDLGGLWEVGQTIDGAYILITQDPVRTNERPKINVYVFDSCTFDLTATGNAYVRNNTLHTTLVYPQKDIRVKLKFQAYKGKSKEVQIVLMVMDQDNHRKMSKYFPIQPISVSDLDNKCDVPNP